MTTLHRFASRAEWLAARRIGGSDVAAILGVSSYRGPWDVLEALRGEAPPDRTDDSRERGRALEPTVLRHYARATRQAVEPSPPHSLYTREDWASATPDAVVRGLVVEVKTDRERRNWGEPTTIERWTPEAAEVVRADYYLQLTHYLWVLDADAGDLAVLVPGSDPFVPELRIYRVLRDRELEARLVDRLRGWWDRHVVRGELLDPDGSEAASRLLAQSVDRGTRQATAREVALAAAYETARTTANQWDTYRRQLGQELVIEAGPFDRLELPRGRVSIVRSEGRTTLDERALLEAHPELAPTLNEYRRRTPGHCYPRVSGFGGSK